MEIPASSPLLPPHQLKKHRFHHPDFNRCHTWVPLVVASLMTVLAFIIVVFIIRKALRTASAPHPLAAAAAAAPEPPPVPVDEIIPSEPPSPESEEGTHAAVPLEIGR